MKITGLTGPYQWFGKELILKAEEGSLISCAGIRGRELSFSINSELADEIRDEMPYDGCDAVFVSSENRVFVADTIVVHSGGDIQMFLKEMGREAIN